MKITMDWKVNLKEKEVIAKVKSANNTAMKIVIVTIANDSIRDSPKLTGHNMRSIKYEVGPHGQIANKEGQGAVYGTSGYSGYLEVGTARMPARSYFRPALDRNIKKLPEQIKAHLS